MCTQQHLNRYTNIDKDHVQRLSPFFVLLMLCICGDGLSFSLGAQPLLTKKFNAMQCIHYVLYSAPFMIQNLRDVTKIMKGPAACILRNARHTAIDLVFQQKFDHMLLDVVAWSICLHRVSDKQHTFEFVILFEHTLVSSQGPEKDFCEEYIYRGKSIYSYVISRERIVGT